MEKKNSYGLSRRWCRRAGLHNVRRKWLALAVDTESFPNVLQGLASLLYTLVQWYGMIYCPSNTFVPFYALDYDSSPYMPSPCLLIPN